uniref:Uncharacterized protein n=2 Tax=Ascaris TaxID=6251 RepID=F1KZR2_ASCSU
MADLTALLRGQEYLNGALQMPRCPAENTWNLGKTESGWEFWTRVYDDPKLHSQILQRYQNAPTISELLMSEKLVVAQVVFLNVPNVSHVGKPAKLVVKQLIESECNRSIIIFDVAVKPKHWLVRFYRTEDAVEVTRIFNGYLYRNRVLVAKLDRTYSISRGRQALILDREDGIGALIASEKLALPSFYDGWTAPERSDIDTYKRNLIKVLEKKLKGAPGFRVDDPRILQLRETAGQFVCNILSVWPIGMFRLCAPEVRLRGRYLDLVHQSQKATWRRVMKEAYPSILTEAWEPMAPSQVKSDYQLVEYAGALLRNFGPQRVATDVPWRIFTATLSTAVDWPTDPVKIMHFLRERSASFVAVDGILFWLNSDVHRDLLAAQILRLPQ